MILNRKKLKMAKWSGEPQWKHTVYQFSLAQTATMINLFYNIFFLSSFITVRILSHI